MLKVVVVLGDSLDPLGLVDVKEDELMLDRRRGAGAVEPKTTVVAIRVHV